MKKITRTTIKNFVAREFKINNLYIKTNSSFDGNQDCVTQVKGNFTKAEPSTMKFSLKNNLGISGIWLVGESRDYFTPYSDDNYIGYEVYNCCGSFIVAMGRPVNY